MKIEIGDEIICRDDFNDYLVVGGAGYFPGRRIVVTRIEEIQPIDRTIYWGTSTDINHNRGRGVFHRAVTKYIPEKKPRKKPRKKLSITKQ